MLSRSFPGHSEISRQAIDRKDVAVSDQRQRIARFGPFELDQRSGELRRAGIRVALPDQPFQVLTALLSNPGELVTREEIQQKLWPADTFVDFDHSLNAAVRKLRTSLDDSAETPRFIETLARHGYRFIAPVEWIDPAGQSEVAATSRTRQRTLRFAAAAAAAVVLLTAGWLVFRAFAIPDGIAVLPFAADKDSDYVAEGVAQSVIGRLSQLKDVRVMAWSTVTRYRKTPPDLKRVGSELNVRAIVNGTLRRQGNVSRITVELIDTADGAQLWGNSYETGSTADLTSVQHQIAVDLARRVSRHPDALRRDKHTPPPDAHDLYMQGLYFFNKRGCENGKKAAELFEAAIARDPRFAEAYAGLASAVGWLAGAPCIPPAEGQMRSKSAGERALALDDSLAEAWASLGAGKATYWWDFAGAERDYKRAIALNPGYANAHFWYGNLLRVTGRAAEGRHETETGYRLDPLSSVAIHSMGASLYSDRKYDEVIALDRRLRQLGVPHVGSWLWSVQSYLASGRFEDALLRNLAEQDFAGDPRVRAEAAVRTHTSRAYYERLANDLASRATTIDPMRVARLYAVLGKREETLTWLNRAYEARAPGLTYFYTDPMFDFLRSDPRSTELARKIRLPQVM